MLNVEIRAVAKYIPDFVVTNDNLSEFLETSDEWIQPRTGISERHIAKEENTSDVAAKVGKLLLEKAGLHGKDIDAIIVATMTPDFLTPSTACIVQDKIGATNAFAFDINAACSGFVYALSMAQKFIVSGLYQTIMVLGVDVNSKILDWNDRATCVLFGDGGGGLILQKSNTPKLWQEDLHADGTQWQAIQANEIPLQNHWNTGEKNVDKLIMNGRDVYSFATREVPKSIMHTAEKAGLTVHDIDYIIPHQANARIIEVFAKKLKVGLDKFYINIGRYGNTTAGTIPIALAEMIEKGIVTLHSGQKLLLTGFGGGLTWGSILIEL